MSGEVGTREEEEEEESKAPSTPRREACLLEAFLTKTKTEGKTTKHFSGSCYLAPSGPLPRGKYIRADLVCFACFWGHCNYERREDTSFLSLAPLLPVRPPASPSSLGPCSIVSRRQIVLLLSLGKIEPLEKRRLWVR